MALSNMQVFNSYLMPLLMEIFPQEIEKFNQASNGTIVLDSANFDGNYLEQSFYSALFASQRRVDRYAANGAASATNLAQDKHLSVKVAGGFGPIIFEPSQLGWLRKPTQEGLTVAANQFASALMADQLNTAILSLVAAIENNAAMVNDVSGTGQAGQGDINTGLAAFGDRSGSISALIMTGAQYHTLIGQAIENSNNLYEIGGVAVRDGRAFGQSRPIVTTDAPALREAGVPNKQKILGLTPMAATVSESSDVITNVETKNGKQRIETSFQADYDFAVKLKGYSWDAANGGASPDDTDLGTGSNWDKVVSNDKDTAGIMIIGQE